MAPPITIAIDAMGGDGGVACATAAAVAVLERHSALQLILVGDSATLAAELDTRPHDSSRLELVHADAVIEDDLRAARALREKRDTSMRRALELVRDGAAQAVVSAGNTGALMALARHLLHTLPDIDRPAICAPLPAPVPSCLLDLGANVDCSADHLHQFALMGSALAASLYAIEKPRVALLNIGAEAVKGNEQVRAAAGLLQSESRINYVGFLEADRLYRGEAEVVVCDGFAGNIALKASEGTARLVRERLQNGLRASLRGRIAGLLGAPALGAVLRELDPRQYNGAVLLGLGGVVVKSHGAGDAFALGIAIERAGQAVESRLVQRVGTHLAVSG